ncbi:MAG TPA: hypothetical protein VNO34_08250 [Actinomycetota bacterium]|nr:hypothetical protein [Actinomycetota bacterium]
MNADALVVTVSAHSLSAFAVGLFVGVCIGLLLGPGLRTWLVRRDWADASREANLTDRALALMEREADDWRPSLDPERPVPTDTEGRRRPDTTLPPPTPPLHPWPPSL